MYLAVRVEGDTAPESDDQVKADSYITLSQSGPEHREDPVQEEVRSSELEVLKVQLRQAEETAHRVQREVPAAATTSGLSADTFMCCHRCLTVIVVSKVYVAKNQISFQNKMKMNI